MKKLTLPCGTTGFFNDKNERVTTGSQMGRRNRLPDDRQTACKLRLIRLRWVDGDYDQWGAYWGGGSGDHIYCATNRAGVDDSYFANGEGQLVEVFVRAATRYEAKVKVIALLPNVKFYR